MCLREGSFWLGGKNLPLEEVRGTWGLREDEEEAMKEALEDACLRDRTHGD